jgi:hypothetical protein
MRALGFVLLTLVLTDPARAQITSSEGSGKLPVRIALGANFGLFSQVPDLRYRRDVYEDLFGDRKGVPAQRYRFLAQNFNLDFLLQNEGGYSSGLQVAMGFRNAIGGDNTSPEGSEFSGLRIAHKQSFAEGLFLVTLGYGLLQSDLLRLYARHHEYRIRLDYVPNPKALNPLEAPFFVRVGPEVIFASPTGVDRADRYGLQWAMNILVRYQGSLGDDMPASLGLQGLFRRIDFFEIGTTREGGAGLLSLSPVSEFLVMQNLWLGLRLDVPVLRPKGREEAFSDAEIPGLYGGTFQFFLRTATF